MAVLTPNFSLPVPGPLDEPCDFAQQWCDFTDATQTVLDTFEAVANRTNPNVPLAKLELRGGVRDMPEDSLIPFDTLVLNNAGMVDFDASTSTITITRPGRFLAVCNVLFTYAPVANMYFSLQFFPTGSGTVQKTLGLDTNLNIGLINVGSCLTGIFHVATPPTIVRVNADMITTPDVISIELAALSLFWFADGASP
jgi:hypothetical protein